MHRRVRHARYLVNRLRAYTDWRIGSIASQLRERTQTGHTNKPPAMRRGLLLLAGLWPYQENLVNFLRSPCLARAGVNIGESILTYTSDWISRIGALSSHVDAFASECMSSHGVNGRADGLSFSDTVSSTLSLFRQRSGLAGPSRADNLARRSRTCPGRDRIESSRRNLPRR